MRDGPQLPAGRHRGARPLRRHDPERLSRSAGWYGEGDDFFFIDGEEEPSLRGTGTEDYFCDAWGFREQDGPFYGTPLWEGCNTGDRGTAYRFHIPDPIVFKKSLRAEIEHKGSQTLSRRQRATASSSATI